MGSAANLFLETVRLYDELHRSGDRRLLARCVELYHPDAELTGAVAGIAVRAVGRAAVRASIEESLANEIRQHHVDIDVVADSDEAAVVRSMLVLEREGTPLLAVPTETDIKVRAALLSSVQVSEVQGPTSPPPYPPLGSTVSYTGEIIGHWLDERLLVRLRDGRAIELAGAEEIADRWNTGDPVMVFFVEGVVVGWYLPEEGLGVDLRGPT